MAFQSQAVSCQGTSFYISTTEKSSLSFTAISKATQAVITVASHTAEVGDSIRIATATGMPEIVGVVATVVATTGTSITINVDSSSFAAAATTGTCFLRNYVKSCELKDVSGMASGESSSIDVSTLCSEAKEYRVGLKDTGSLTGTLNWVADDAFQKELLLAMNQGGALSVRYFKMVLNDKTAALTKPTTIAVTGFVKSYAGPDISVDGVLTGSMSVQLTGDMVVVARSA